MLQPNPVSGNSGEERKHTVTATQLCDLADRANFCESICHLAAEAVSRGELQQVQTILHGAEYWLGKLANDIENAGEVQS